MDDGRVCVGFCVWGGRLGGGGGGGGGGEEGILRGAYVCCVAFTNQLLLCRRSSGNSKGATVSRDALVGRTPKRKR